jgi:hypothetical protein
MRNDNAPVLGYEHGTRQPPRFRLLPASGRRHLGLHSPLIAVSTVLLVSECCAGGAGCRCVLLRLRAARASRAGATSFSARGDKRTERASRIGWRMASSRAARPRRGRRAAVAGEIQHSTSERNDLRRCALCVLHSARLLALHRVRGARTRCGIAPRLCRLPPCVPLPLQASLLPWTGESAYQCGKPCVGLSSMACSEGLRGGGTCRGDAAKSAPGLPEGRILLPSAFSHCSTTLAPRLVSRVVCVCWGG